MTFGSQRRDGHATTQALRRRDVGLEVAWQARVAAVDEHLGPALAGDGVGVHQARVASRRLRETLPLAAAVIPDDVAADASRLLRRLTRTLGAVRELDVARTVTAESVADDTLRADIDALIVARRDLARATLVETWTADRVAWLQRRLARVAECLVAASDDAARARWHESLGLRLARRADERILRCPAATLVYDSERLHAIRIATKKLRYVVEVAGDLRLAAAARALKTLKKHQDTLGHLHDLDVLAAFAASVPSPGLAAAQAAWARDVHAHHARHLRGRAALLRVADLVHDRMSPRVRGLADHAPAPTLAR